MNFRPLGLFCFSTLAALSLLLAACAAPPLDPGRGPAEATVPSIGVAPSPTALNSVDEVFPTPVPSLSGTPAPTPVSHDDQPARDPKGHPIPPTPSGPLIYYWPAELPADLALDPARSIASDTGFQLAFTQSTGSTLIFSGGSPAGDVLLCPPTAKTLSLSGRSVCVLAVGDATSLQWYENGHPYSLGGPGFSLATLQSIVENLEALDLPALQQHLETGS